MVGPDGSSFQAFKSARTDRLQHISKHTRNDYTVDDVATEAWILAIHLRETRGVEIDFTDPGHQEWLLKSLYVRLVRGREQTVRHATRLDHYAYGDNPDHDVHPLLNKLVANDGADPLDTLLMLEEASEEPPEPSPHASQAAAYLRLMQRCDNRMALVAPHLLISLSYCYKRFNRACLLAEFQMPLPEEEVTGEDDFLPGAWRSFQIFRSSPPRDSVQLAFEFGSEV